MNHFPPSPEAPMIPDHQLVKRIGQGAYGEIWLARNVIGTYRAVKIVYRSQFDSPKPFEREFAGLKAFEPISRSHPGLVDILQVGRNDEAGYLYYVMELADDQIVGNHVHPDTYSAKTLGREISRRGRLPVNEALRIGTSLAAALAHLHKAGLVHRDIKPSNIIFVDGEPKLADIGLVVSLADAHTFVGSEGYIPPEGPGSIQADIYSLGKVLYEITTGQDKDLFPELPGDIASLEDRGDILEMNEVVVKACAHKPQARYATADDLRADLEMIFAGRSVKRLHFMERQLARATRVAAVAIGLAVVAGVLAYAVNRVRNREKELLGSAYVANGVELVSDGNLHAAVPLFAAALRLQEKDPAAEEATRLRIGVALQQAPRLLQFWEGTAAVDDLRFSPDGRHLLVAAKKHVRLLEVATGATNAEFKIKHTIYGTSFSPDGKRIAVANGKGVTMIDVATGTNIFDLQRQSLILSVDFSPDGKTLVLGRDGRAAKLVDAANGEPVGELVGHSQEVSYAAWSVDGTRIVTASRDGTARLWDARTSQSLAVLRHAEWVQDVAISPDGRRVVTASSDHTIWVWDVTGQPRVLCRFEHRGAVQRVRFSPDGHCLASAGMDQTVRLWNPTTGQPLTPIINLHMPALNVAFSPEGRRIAVAGQSGHVRIWDVFADAPLNVGQGVVSADGARYITFSSNSFQFWNARDDAALTPRLTVTQEIVSISCNANGRTIAILGKRPKRSGLVSIYTADQNAPRELEAAPPAKMALLSPDGAKLLTTSGSTAAVWNATSGTLLFNSGRLPAHVQCAAFSPDGQTLALGCENTLLVMDAETSGIRFEQPQHQLPVNKVIFTPDSSRVITTTADADYNPGAAFVWSVRNGDKLAEFNLHTDGVISATVTSDGRWIATGGEDANAFIWNTVTGQPRTERLSLLWQVRSVNFSADGRWLIASSRNETQLWEARNGLALSPVLRLPGPGSIFDSGFCAGGRRIWMRSSTGLRFLDLPRAEGDADALVALADRLGVTIPNRIPWNSTVLPLDRMRERCAADRARVESTVAAWDEQQTAACERDGDWFAVQFHLQRLIRSAPADADLLARLAIAQARLRSVDSPESIVHP